MTAGETPPGPVMLRANFDVPSTPADTFLDMGAWSKGFIYVNGFPLGRHFYLGPQITSFIPAPFLVQGNNQIVVFEHYTPSSQIVFTNAPNLGRAKPSLPRA
ncbi:hypothetical protein B566_EDAN016674 [Ephemera danica]|nr:hypothetical protein B566_EDAN016674 [Ephemera danica]